jgi:RNA polymerase sigma-B factor
MVIVVSPAYREKASSPFPTSSRPIDSANRLASSFTYLCARGARKFLRAGLERCDLEQVAALGLIKASRRYDATSRTPFEAYAWLTIVGELLHYVRDHEHHVRVPRRLFELERDVARAEEALVTRLQRQPAAAEIAEALGVSAAAVQRARHPRGVRHLSLEEAPARALASDELASDDRLALDCAFASLGVLERRVVGGVYLLGLSQRELARSLGLPPKNVSRIHLGALARMRRAWTV